MTRPNPSSLITKDLGYCCLWFFFTHFKRPRLIADRLGYHVSTIQLIKADVLAGKHKCLGCEGCLHKKVTLAKTVRVRDGTQSKSAEESKQPAPRKP